MNELVSIIMPAYNASNYIKQSIISVQSQTYVNWELLIVDDCSTDETCDIVNSIDDSRIVLLHNSKNSGAAISRNYALREAKGKWIAFLDSDDIWESEKLSRQLKYMSENHYCFTFTDYRVCIDGSKSPYVITGPDIVNKRKMYDYCYFATSTVIYEKEKIGLIQIADLKKNNDYAMWLKAIEKCNAHRLPECLTYYVKHEGSISSGRKFKLIKWHYILFREGMGKSPIVSIVFTANNLVHGVWKKIYYKRKAR